ncbi:hypothetical protein [Corynebacterium aurimucosum]|uniref:hypothetical protein n=1 Tax=Corynebacterium aurimucosum TaxID=169292 RepID=UPI00187A051E|nr:hypothetical protein [Corynebacterium aurimucosum]MBE7338102.1 hypothetical protein [Corynebacterium aurimucosum]
MTSLAIIIYGGALIFTLIYAMDMKAIVRQLQDVVVDLDRDLAVVEATLREREEHATGCPLAANYHDLRRDYEIGIGGPVAD